MTLVEAQHRARQLGYAACMDERGWCLLTVPGVEMLARGSTWTQAFDRLAEEVARRASVCVECEGAGCLFCAGR